MIYRHKILLLMTLIFCILLVIPVAAVAPVPPSGWYAVAWVEGTDTLHWINAAGEQISIDRPQLPGEAPNSGQTQLHISPNGKYMVVIAPLTNGNWGVGFFDFALGQFVQTHEAQPGETPSAIPSAGYTLTSLHFAMVLRTAATGEWRIIVFESSSGDALAQLTRNEDFFPGNFITDTAWWPAIAHFNIDEGIGQLAVRFQMVTNPQALQTTFPSFIWYPLAPPAVEPVIADSVFYSRQAGFDILPTTGAAVFARFNEEAGEPQAASDANMIQVQQSAAQLPVTLVSDGSAMVDSPVWLRGGEWIGFRVINGVNPPFYSVMTNVAADNVPLGPNFTQLHATPDGFVAVSQTDWSLYHVTSLGFDAFAAIVGNDIFSPGQVFTVVYTTPAGSPFSLTDIADTVIADGLDIAAPTCQGAPAARLTVGETARVTFTNGQDLNIRTAPAGDYIMQIPEGTVATVLEGPICAGGFQWWNLSLGNGTGGWGAEGDLDEYYLEPFDPIIGVVTPQGLVPTATSIQLQAPPTSTPLQLQIVTIPAQVNCPQSPPTQLQVGMAAVSASTAGTYALRINLTDEVPTYQLNGNVGLTIIEGPQCRNGIRMWKVRTFISGQQVEAWMAEGVGQTYYIVP